MIEPSPGPIPAALRTAASRKAAQRERARVALVAPGAALDAVTTTALAEALPLLIRDAARKQTLAAALIELGRRGGVSVCVISSRRVT